MGADWSRVGQRGYQAWEEAATLLPKGNQGIDPGAVLRVLIQVVMLNDVVVRPLTIHMEWTGDAD